MLEKYIFCDTGGPRSPSFESDRVLYITPTYISSIQELILQGMQLYLEKSCFRCTKNTWHVKSKYILQPPKYLIIIVNRFRYINNNCTYDRCFIPMDTSTGIDADASKGETSRVILTASWFIAINVGYWKQQGPHLSCSPIVQIPKIRLNPEPSSWNPRFLLLSEQLEVILVVRTLMSYCSNCLLINAFLLIWNLWYQQMVLCC